MLEVWNVFLRGKVLYEEMRKSLVLQYIYEEVISYLLLGTQIPNKFPFL
jgi:hypothetical protein